MDNVIHKNRMTTHILTLWLVDVTSLTRSVSTMRFLTEIMLILKVIKFHLKEPYDKQNLTLVVILYEIYETRRRLVSLISYEMTTCVRSLFKTWTSTDSKVMQQIMKKCELINDPKWILSQV